MDQHSAAISGNQRRPAVITLPSDGRVAYRINEIAEMLGVSRSFVYSALKRGQVRAVEVSRVRMIPRSELERLLANFE